MADEMKTEPEEIEETEQVTTGDPPPAELPTPDPDPDSVWEDGVDNAIEDFGKITDSLTKMCVDLKKENDNLRKMILSINKQVNKNKTMINGLAGKPDGDRGFEVPDNASISEHRHPVTLNVKGRQVVKG